ncbi:SMP-30/gluconolactonase/LRE family protein [Acuticoccus sp. M5D2P5]|uniref:SMP-30/gluconolactonase/LRE family protein n=1 Tax=Acuticoccus kalidii TaxID=2910977 RepID=UPI001F24C373|nr:SMP-30/gluconolactonase/LRE family protein [Acuticoccus kalidii]MCF3935480.1 SMP-30/gluconolactonase/LRE family protein [Acuticoccus kalidii]
MLFMNPRVIDAAPFARLPDDMRTGGPSEWRDGQPMTTPEHSLLEGPAFDREGNLWCVDIAYGRIFKVSPDGAFQTVITYEGEPNGLAFHRDGRLFIADYRNGIMVYDPAKGTVERFFDRYRLERLKAVNDLTFSTTGDLYFTDQGMTGMHDPTGRVFRIRADGTVDCLIDNVPSPNGLVLSPDEKTLYVAVTRANAIWRVPLLPDGGVAKVGVFIQLSGGGGPDGLAIDRDGGLAICHIGLGSVWLLNPRGEFVARVVSHEGDHTTNAAFGGPGNGDLFITESESGTILRAASGTVGATLFGEM